MKLGGTEQEAAALVGVSNHLQSFMSMALLTCSVGCGVRCTMLFWMSKGAQLVPLRKKQIVPQITMNQVWIMGLKADQSNHFHFYLLKFCMLIPGMAHGLLNLKFLLVSGIWRKYYCCLYLASHIYWHESYSIQMP